MNSEAFWGKVEVSCIVCVLLADIQASNHRTRGLQSRSHSDAIDLSLVGNFAIFERETGVMML
jgi:hypothetical protein